MVEDGFDGVVRGGSVGGGLVVVGGVVLVEPGRDDGVRGLQVAVVEGVVGPAGQVHHDEGAVVGRVEDVEVHGGDLDEGGAGGDGEGGGPGGVGPVFVLKGLVGGRL